MLLNYLKLATRLLMRIPFLTIINVVGLSVGLATFLLLWPLAEFELRSDQYHEDADRIIRLDVDYKWTDDNQTWNGVLGAFNWIAVNNEIVRTFSQVDTSAWIIPQSFFTQPKSKLDRNIFITILSDSESESFGESHASIGSHVDLHWWHYAIPVCILVIIMFSTIASILVKAARTNPTESLRYE